jgi:SAM-dependent methyltransferase
LGYSVRVPEFVDQFNREYFDGDLSPAVLDRLRQLPVGRDDARAFLDRMGRLARASGLDARDLSPFQADILASLISRLLPGTWDGRVPPITIPGRHRKIDGIVGRLCGPSGRLIDVACGFPPFTSVDTAIALPGWDVVGVDRSLPEYLVEDGLGNYAVFDASGAAQYFQPIAPTADSWVALLNDPDATRRRLETLLQDLLGVRARSTGDPHRIAHGGATLVVTPAREYARDNLHFLRSDLEALAIPPADVVRCFNMLMYFDDAFRKRALDQFARLLKEGGLAVCGVNWAFSMEARYATYRKTGGALVPVEFAFGLDNLVPIGIATWYTLQADDRDADMLARFCGMLRSNQAFFAEYARVADGIRDEIGLCPRQSDGYFADIDKDIPPAELWARAAGFPDKLDAALGERAVDVLRESGYAARLNEVGHIAVRL